MRGLIAMNHDWDRKGAEEALLRALELGPGAAEAHLWNAWRLALLERRYDQALAELSEAERLDPLDLQLNTQIGYVHFFMHDLDRAIEQFERAIELAGRSANHVGVLGYAHGRAGNLERAKALLGELRERAAQGYVPAMWTALVHLGLGDLDGVFQELERAFQERDGSLVLITSAIEFDPVRRDPRFGSLLERMGLSHLARG